MEARRRMVDLFACVILIAIGSNSASAQHSHGLSPYSHGQSSEISSLTVDEVRELQTGEGMGLARAAELNHFPGPKHILELASELGLDHAQAERIDAIHAKMKTRAIAKGEEILEAERHLAGLFASGQPSVVAVKRIAEHLGTMRGQLQAIHLLAHIESADVLRGEQIEDYDRLRGYRN